MSLDTSPMHHHKTRHKSPERFEIQHNKCVTNQQKTRDFQEKYQFFIGKKIISLNFTAYYFSIFNISNLEIIFQHLWLVLKQEISRKLKWNRSHLVHLTGMMITLFALCNSRTARSSNFKSLKLCDIWIIMSLNTLYFKFKSPVQ